VTASTLPASGASHLRRGLGQRLGPIFGAVVLPALAALLVLRYAVPSRFGGAGGGLGGFLAELGDRYPLFLGLAIFVAFSEVGRYWTRRLRPEAPERSSVAGGSSVRRPRRILIAFAAVAVIAFVTRSSVVATFRIVGPSMLPTLEIGDRVLVNRLAYGVTLPLSKARLRSKVPRRGDMVVFRADGLAGSDKAQSFVKRVIGVPGDTVSFQEGSLRINDWRVPTCDAGPYSMTIGRLTVRGRLTVEYLGDKTYLTVRKPLEAPFAGYTVKEDEVFVVGDDRGMSTDSRLWNEGRGAGVPINILEGRVSRVLLGARPDGRLDFSRLLAPPLDLKVRIPGISMGKTDQRIRNCLDRRPAETSPPPSAVASATPH
jgi:signal peptidase I